MVGFLKNEENHGKIMDFNIHTAQYAVKK